MKLHEYQRAVQKLSLELAPDRRELPAFQLYREMIQSRFSSMARVAFRRSWALLGEHRCAQSFARYLATEGPSSPILREVIERYGAFAVRDRELLQGAPDAAADLLRFEATTWRISSDDAQLPPSLSLREVDFEGVLVLNPTLTMLALEYDVSESALATMPRDPHTLLLYRRRAEDDVRWYRAPRVLSELLALEGGSERSLAELVRSLFERSHPGSAEELLEELASALTVAVERGVVWGVRDPA
ncbi:MAG: hypothetical protein JWN04_5978 [Myxococcaceae bacterium]|nr:hypothetical protein [Myxococcaceae bacterium]